MRLLARAWLFQRQKTTESEESRLEHVHAQDGPLGSQRVFVINITAIGMKDFVLIGECSMAILCLTSHREFLTSHTAR